MSADLECRITAVTLNEVHDKTDIPERDVKRRVEAPRRAVRNPAELLARWEQAGPDRPILGIPFSLEETVKVLRSATNRNRRC